MIKKVREREREPLVNRKKEGLKFGRTSKMKLLPLMMKLKAYILAVLNESTVVYGLPLL